MKSDKSEIKKTKRKQKENSYENKRKKSVCACVCATENENKMGTIIALIVIFVTAQDHKGRKKSRKQVWNK